MNTKSIVNNAAQIIAEPLETLASQVARPLVNEAISEFGAFFGSPKKLGQKPKTLAQEDLMRARNEQKIHEMEVNDEQASRERISKINQEYKMYDLKVAKEDESIRSEVIELQEEVVKLAKSAGVDTKAHLENVPKKVGVLHIKVLTSIIRTLRVKAEESKNAQALVTQRNNAKPPTGMLAWVSGKQMKVHEQGTLQLQG